MFCNAAPYLYSRKSTQGVMPSFQKVGCVGKRGGEVMTRVSHVSISGRVFFHLRLGM